MKRFLFIGFYLFPFLSFAQKENNIWYFGDRAGINFNVDPPQPLTNNKMTSIVACASIADKNGELLFYTDADTVWNKAHQVMVNGTSLTAEWSADAGKVVIVKHPGNNNEYYIFTTDYDGGGASKSLRYAVVDMNAENGFGKVITKNNILAQPVSDKLVAVQHNNGKDVWIIVCGLGNNRMIYPYLLTDAAVPVAYPPLDILIQQSQPANIAGGEMKISPNTKKMALAYLGTNKIDVLDFDNSTGIFSNLIQINNNTLKHNPYGIAFSPDNSKLYTTIIGGNNYIYQFDLNVGDNAAIINSKQTIAHYESIAFGDNENWDEITGLQLAPDGKIYAVHYKGNYGNSNLCVINKPNEAGTACDFVQNGFSLGGKNAIEGLPLSVVYFNPLDFTFSNTCSGDSTSFSPINTADGETYAWNFGEVDSPQNTSTLKNPKHSFSQAGEYTVTLVSVNQNISKKITISSTPVNTLKIEGDTSFCEGTNTLLKTDFNPDYIYQWYKNDKLLAGETDNKLEVATSGNYYVVVSKANCINTSKKQTLEVISYPHLSVKKEIWLCKNEFIVIGTENEEKVKYKWSTGDTIPFITVSQEGNYWLKASLQECTIIDTVRVNFYTTPNIPNVITPNGDNKNDWFSLSDLPSGSELKVYNRWGKLVYENKNYENNWGGKGLSDGIYFYLLSVKENCYAPIKGWVQLLNAN